MSLLRVSGTDFIVRGYKYILFANCLFVGARTGHVFKMHGMGSCCAGVFVMATPCSIKRFPYTTASWNRRLSRKIVSHTSTQSTEGNKNVADLQTNLSLRQDCRPMKTLETIHLSFRS